MPTAKGTVYLAMRTYVEKTFGKEAVDRVLAKLSPEDRETLRVILPVGKYDIAPALRFEEAADVLLGRGDYSTCFEMGRFAASWQLNSFHKVFLRFSRPQLLLEKGAELWSHYHDTGRWKMDPPAPGRIQAHLLDFAVATPAFCTHLSGWVTAAIEVTGARNVKVAHLHPVCRALGGPECEIVVTFTE